MTKRGHPKILAVEMLHFV